MMESIGKHLRPLLRSWHGKILLIILAVSEVLGLLSLVPFAFAFRPYGVFALVGGSLAMFVLAMERRKNYVRAVDRVNGVVESTYAYFLWLIMNPYPGQYIRGRHDMRQLAVICKPVLWALALATTGAQAWQDPVVLARIWDTKLWTSVIILLLAVLGLLGYLCTAPLLWRRGYFSEP